MVLKNNGKFIEYINHGNITWFYPLIKLYIEKKIGEVLNTGNRKYTIHWDMEGIGLTLHGIELIQLNYDCGWQVTYGVDIRNDGYLETIDDIQEFKRRVNERRECGKDLRLKIVRDFIGNILDELLDMHGRVTYTLTDIGFEEDWTRFVLNFSGYKYYFSNLGLVYCLID